MSRERARMLVAQKCQQLLPHFIAQISKRARILGGGIQRMSLDRATTAGGATPAAQRAERTDVA